MNTTEKLIERIQWGNITRDEIIDTLEEVKEMEFDNSTTNALMDEISDFKDEVDKLEDEVSDLEDDIRDLEKNIERLEDENRELSERLTG